MTVFSRVLALFLGLAIINLVVAEQSRRLGELQIDQPWARATPHGAISGAGFFTVSNHGADADRLIRAESSISSVVELHRTEFVDNVMKMRKQDAIEIPPGQNLVFEPGSYHIMFIGLHDMLSEGQTIAVTLVFENAGAIDLTFPVKSLTAGADKPHGAMPMQHHGSGHGTKN